MSDSKFYNALGEKIRQARKESQLSQKKLAEILDKGSSTYIALIESGKRRVSVEDLCKIAVALHKDLSFFFEEEYENLDTKEVLKIALRADHDLTNEEKRKILRFYEFIKHHKNVDDFRQSL